MYNGPSAMTLQSPFPHEVKELTVEEIHGITEDYSRAAQIAIQSGIRRARNFIGTAITYPNLSSQRSQMSVQMNMAVRH